MTEPVSQQEERVTLTDTQWRCLLYGTLAKGETPDVEQIMTPPVAKLSRSKNLKTERDYIEKSARNRSKSRYKATQWINCHKPENSHLPNPPRMQYTYRIVILNNKCITSATQHHMLEAFLRKHEVDIALLQQVTPGTNITFRIYNSYLNIIMSERGTAILCKTELPLHTFERITSGRGLVAYCGHIYIINIYPPNRSSNRAETEAFFNTEITEHLSRVATEMIMADDFECVLSNSDCTGHRPNSWALKWVVQFPRLCDIWDRHSKPKAKKHFTPTCCSSPCKDTCDGRTAASNAMSVKDGGFVIWPSGCPPSVNL